MLPSHHTKHRPNSRTNGMYICVVASLAICLLLTFFYWRWEVNSLISVNEDLRRELTHTQEKLKKKDGELKMYTDKIQSLANENKQAQEELSKENNEIETMRNENKALESENETINDKLSEITDKLSEATKENQQLSSKLETLETKNDEFVSEKESEISSLKKDLESATNLVKQLEAERAEKQSSSNPSSPNIQASPTTADSKQTQHAVSGQMKNDQAVMNSRRREVNPLYLSAPDMHDTGSAGNLTNPRTGDFNKMHEGMLSESVLQEI